jgi:tripartite-type tricarboxylate transporter receptor subunit TctC
MTDTVSGRIHYAMTAVLSSIPMLREGRLIALGVSARERIPLLPDVPAIAEAGVPDYEYVGWWGVLVPAKTPRAVIDKLGNEIRRIIDLPEYKDRVGAIGAHARHSTPDEFAKLIRTEFENRGKIFRAAGAKVG